MRVFFFGPLAVPGVLEIVTGGASTTKAVLPGFRAASAALTEIPCVAPDKGALAGLCFDADADRLAWVQNLAACLGADLAEYNLQDGPALVLAASGLETAPSWSADYTDAWGPVFAEALSEVAHLGQGPGAIPAPLQFNMMKMRAFARLQAQKYPAPPSASGLTADAVTVHTRTQPYTNYFAVGEVEISHPSFTGSKVGPVKRAVFLATDASIVLAYDPKRDRVFLVEQLRLGPFMSGDPNPWMMEPIAGRVDPGEHPEQTATREALEEAGLVLGSLHHVHSGYASPGATTEYFHVFVGECDLPDDAAQIAGLVSEAEDIQGHILDFTAFETGLTSGQYPVTPLALAGYWLMANRDRLRAKA